MYKDTVFPLYNHCSTVILQIHVIIVQWQNDRYVIENHIQKKAIRHGQPIFIVNLKSNTMKNTVQIYELYVM